MRLKILGLLIGVLFISGCSWRGYINPQEQDFKPVSRYLLGTQNFNNNDLSQKRLELVEKALADVQYIFFENKSFEKIISSSNWVASCDGEEIDKISGEQLLADLRKLNVKVSIFPKKPWMAIGLTDTANNRIAIDPYRIDLANENEVVDSSWLIDTMAHEITHLILSENGMVKYRDRGHGKKGCTKNDLASYRVGKAAQAAWIHQQLLGAEPAR